VEDANDIQFFEEILPSYPLNRQVSIMKEKYFTRKAHLIKAKNENSRLAKQIGELERKIFRFEENEGKLIYIRLIMKMN
jgi:hypothetical protein